MNKLYCLYYGILFTSEQNIQFFPDKVLLTQSLLTFSAFITTFVKHLNRRQLSLKIMKKTSESLAENRVFPSVTIFLPLSFNTST